MKSKEITIITNTQGSELVAYLLEELGSEGVSIKDSSDFAELLKTDTIWDYVDESVLLKDDNVYVSGYFNIEEDKEKIVKEKLEEIKNDFPYDMGPLTIKTAIMDDKNWAEEWKKYYKPIHYNDIVIVPEWIDYKPKENEKIVRIDPGMAFGTGSHESTGICLELMSRVDFKGKNVVDVGTGSGILGITAAVLGANKVEAYDLDDIAVEAAKTNALLNKIKTFNVEKANLIDKTNEIFDIALANITADVLKMLAKDIGSKLVKNAKLIISGIIATRKDEVINAFIGVGFSVIEEISINDWRGYLLEKDGN